MKMDKSKIIPNNVVGSTYLHRTELKNFQGDLKQQNNNKEIQMLSNRIKKGFDAPIYIWYENNNYILDGHQRLKALNKLADKGFLLEDDKIPVVYIKAETEKEAKEKVLEYNSKYSEIDKIELDIFSEGLDIEDILIPGLDIVLTEEDKLKEEKEDDVPEIPKPMGIINRGDIIELGNHKIMCGDSMDEKDIQKLLKDKNGQKTHCISDPPYGIKYDNGDHGMIKNDDTFLDYVGLAMKYTDGYFAMRTGYQVVSEWIQIIKKQLPITNMIIRHKGGGGMGDCLRNLAQDFEILLVSNRLNYLQGMNRGGATRYWQQQDKTKYINSAKKEELQGILHEMNLGQCIWRVGKDRAISYIHPTQKPVGINQRVLENFTSPGDNVLDLFLGSGSNLIACQKMNRICYGMELDELYCEKIITRYVQYMNEDTVKINGKERNRNDLVSKHKDNVF